MSSASENMTKSTNNEQPASEASKHKLANPFEAISKLDSRKASVDEDSTKETAETLRKVSRTSKMDEIARAFEISAPKEDIQPEAEPQTATEQVPEAEAEAEIQEKKPPKLYNSTPDESEEKEESEETDEDIPPDAKVVVRHFNDKEKLISILTDAKIANKIFIRKLFFAGETTGAAGAKNLNDLLKECDVPAKQRKRVLWLYFDKNPEQFGLTFDDENEKADLSNLALKTNEELIEYPIRAPDGSFVKDKNGVPIVVKLTKSQLYWQMQEEKAMRAQQTSGNGVEKLFAMIMETQKQNTNLVLSLMSDRVRQAESRANSDPFQTVASVLNTVERFGYHKETSKDEVDRIKAQGDIAKDLVVTAAKEISPEIRGGFKDVITTLKDIGEIQSDKSKTKEEFIPNIPKDQQEEIFRSLYEGAIIGNKKNSNSSQVNQVAQEASD
jgi:hypothetical protein